MKRAPSDAPPPPAPSWTARTKEGSTGFVTHAQAGQPELLDSGQRRRPGTWNERVTPDREFRNVLVQRRT